LALCIALRCTALLYFASHMHVYSFVIHLALVHIALLSLELYFIALPRTSFAHFCL
jgi:hypothetical protein